MMSLRKATVLSLDSTPSKEDQMMYNAGHVNYVAYGLNQPTAKQKRKRFQSVPSPSSGLPQSLKGLRKFRKRLDKSAKPNYRNMSNPNAE